MASNPNRGKIVPNLAVLERELIAARKRQVAQQQLVKDTQESLAYAISMGLSSTESVVRAKLPRVQSALASSGAVVAELEAAVGQLRLSQEP